MCLAVPAVSSSYMLRVFNMAMFTGGALGLSNIPAFSVGSFVFTLCTSRFLLNLFPKDTLGTHHQHQNQRYINQNQLVGS